MTEPQPRLRTEAGRSVLHIERDLAAAPELVWKALTESERVEVWFPSRVQIELRVGGRIDFLDFEGLEGSSGRVTELVDGRRLAFTWGDDHLDFELIPIHHGTRLRLVHTFDDHFGAASFASGWIICLDALEGELDPRHQERERDALALHEELVTTLRLDTGVLRRTDTGWEITYERQLVVPAEVAETDLIPLLRNALPGDATIDLTQGTGHGARLHLRLHGEEADGEHARVLLRDTVERAIAAL